MTKKVSPKLFYTIITVVCLVVGMILYRQATDPLYHVEPDEEAARRQFTKPAPAASDPSKSASTKSDTSAKRQKASDQEKISKQTDN